MREVCLFGTSADPPTGSKGHGAIVKFLASMKDERNGSLLPKFDEIRIMPVYRHMFIEKRERVQAATFEQKLEMCHLNFVPDPSKKIKEDESCAIVTVSDVERVVFQILNPTASPTSPPVPVGTVDILEYLVAHEPYTTFYLCLGADTYRDICSGKWRRTQDLVNVLQDRIIVIDRTEQRNEDLATSVEELAQIHRNVYESRVDHRSFANGNNASIAVPASVFRLPDVFQANVSSSRVRVSTDTTFLSHYLTPSVLKYIQSNKLYAFGDSGGSTCSL